mmetsp:Transcript_42634/g.92910  ORF Transcript_42634/g.92910 Transcript_42634/m.92910 type:complete len:239 (-) Transcript_42634:368-1084(-)
MVCVPAEDDNAALRKLVPVAESRRNEGCGVRSPAHRFPTFGISPRPGPHPLHVRGCVVPALGQDSNGPVIVLVAIATLRATEGQNQHIILIRACCWSTSGRRHMIHGGPVNAEPQGSARLHPSAVSRLSALCSATEMPRSSRRCLALAVPFQRSSPQIHERRPMQVCHWPSLGPASVGEEPVTRRTDKDLGLRHPLAKPVLSAVVAPGGHVGEVRPAQLPVLGPPRRAPVMTPQDLAL